MLRAIYSQLQILGDLEKKAIEEGFVGALDFYYSIRKKLLSGLLEEQQEYTKSDIALLREIVRKQEELEACIVKKKEQLAASLRNKKKQNKYGHALFAKEHQMYLKSV